jgi:hypothetical protein
MLPVDAILSILIPSPKILFHDRRSWSDYCHDPVDHRQHYSHILKTIFICDTTHLSHVKIIVAQPPTHHAKSSKSSKADHSAHTTYSECYCLTTPGLQVLLARFMFAGR